MGDLILGAILQYMVYASFSCFSQVVKLRVSTGKLIRSSIFFQVDHTHRRPSAEACPNHCSVVLLRNNTVKLGHAIHPYHSPARHSSHHSRPHRHISRPKGYTPPACRDTETQNFHMLGSLCVCVCVCVYPYTHK